MAVPIKMDELLVSWLGSDAVYENVLSLIDNYRAAQLKQQDKQLIKQQSGLSPPGSPKSSASSRRKSTGKDDFDPANGDISSTSPRGVIPPFYPLRTSNGREFRRRRTAPRQYDTWDPLPPSEGGPNGSRDGSMKNKASALDMMSTGEDTSAGGGPPHLNSIPANAEDEDDIDPNVKCVRDQIQAIYAEHGQDPPLTSPGSVDSSNSSSEDDDGMPRSRDRYSTTASNMDDDPRRNRKYLTLDSFVRITKEVFRFPSFFNAPLYQRILDLWNASPRGGGSGASDMEVVTYEILRWYWMMEMEPYDAPERFYRLLKQPENDFIVRDDFLPYIKALLNEHPGLEFLSNHAEFQEKYAVTVITRIFYSVNKCHSGRITSRQIRRSDLLDAFQLVDEEEDINKVTRYFSYEHFYVLYCRFWELDQDRDYRITREDLLKYGDHSLSHMIVDRIFDAAPRPFGQDKVNREFLSYDDFIYFMLSEEDKANEVSVRYWFSCVDVDGDAKLNNMEMRSFYAVQLHRMQCMGHEIVPFEDMLCQMMDMIKPKNTDYLVAEDFLQPECCQVSGALYDALFNLNKYLLFEQRDPFVERQKREDEFDTDWDRFACIDYNRLAMEEEAREEEAMEIDWVTVDDEEDDGEDMHGGALAAASEAPF